jgi:predicted transcriptional regulator
MEALLAQQQEAQLNELAAKTGREPGNLSDLKGAERPIAPEDPR